MKPIRIRKPRSTNTQKRRGVSLVELLITMSIASVVMATGIGTLHLLLRTETALVSTNQRSLTVSRVSRVFREDVHAATKVELIPGFINLTATALKIEFATNHIVRYSIEEQTLRRTETRDETTIHTEHFRFAPGTTMSFTHANLNTTHQVALVVANANSQPLKPTLNPKSVPLRQLKIQAVVGRNHRFEQHDENRND